MGTEPRMTWQTQAVLKYLLADLTGEHYGLEISEHVGLPAPSIYVILARLERFGWVTSEWESIDEALAGRRKRRYYRLTASGAERAVELVQTAAPPVWSDSTGRQQTPGGRGRAATPGWTTS